MDVDKLFNITRSTNQIVAYDYNVNTNLRTPDNYKKGGTIKPDILLGRPKKMSGLIVPPFL